MSLVRASSVLSKGEGFGFRKSCMNPVTQQNTRAGEKWRTSRGRSRCGNEEGPIHDLSDWYFVGAYSSTEY